MCDIAPVKAGSSGAAEGSAGAASRLSWGAGSPGASFWRALTDECATAGGGPKNPLLSPCDPDFPPATDRFVILGAAAVSAASAADDDDTASPPAVP